MWTITSVIWAVYSNHSFTNISGENINFHIFILRLLPGMRMRGIVNTQNTHKQQNLSKVMSIRPSMAWQPSLMLDVNGLMITWSTPRVLSLGHGRRRLQKYQRQKSLLPFSYDIFSNLVFGGYFHPLFIHFVDFSPFWYLKQTFL